MGKGDRRKKQPLPKLAPAPRKKARGHARMREIRNLDNVVLQARARHCGGADIEAMKSQMLGDDAGKALWMVLGGDAVKAYEAFNGYRGAQERYHRIALGKSLHAKTAKIETAPERFETRPDDQPDLRTEDERHRDAINNYQRWMDLMGRIPLHLSASIHSAINGWVILIDAGQVTPKGKAFCDACVALAEALDGERK